MGIEVAIVLIWAGYALANAGYVYAALALGFAGMSLGVYSLLNPPSPGIGKAASFDIDPSKKVQVPLVKDGEPIAVMYGTAKMPGALLFYGPTYVRSQKIKGQQVGFYYFMQMAIGYSHGVVDRVNNVIYREESITSEGHGGSQHNIGSGGSVRGTDDVTDLGTFQRSWLHIQTHGVSNFAFWGTENLEDFPANTDLSLSTWYNEIGETSSEFVVTMRGIFWMWYQGFGMGPNPILGPLSAICCRVLPDIKLQGTSDILYEYDAGDDGTAAFTFLLKEVNGTGTAFKTRYKKGDWVKIGTIAAAQAINQVKEVVSDTLMRMWDAFPSTASSQEHRVVSGGANAAHIIFDYLTNTIYGLGLDPTTDSSNVDIDVDSFNTVANTLTTEVFNISLYIDRVTSAEEVIDQILKHIDGLLIISNGKYKLGLVRPLTQGQIDALPIIDESTILQNTINYRKQSIDKTYNKVIVQYTDVRDGFNSRGIEADNLANRRLQGSIKALTLHLPGIMRKEDAQRMAQNVLPRVSHAAGVITFKANRKVFTHEIGDRVKISVSEIGLIERVFFINGIREASLESNDFDILAEEDTSMFIDVSVDDVIAADENTRLDQLSDFTDILLTEPPYEIFKNIEDNPFLFLVSRETTTKSEALFQVMHSQRLLDNYVDLELIGFFPPSAILDENYSPDNNEFKIDEGGIGVTVPDEGGGIYLEGIHCTFKDDSWKETNLFAGFTDNKDWYVGETLAVFHGNTTVNTGILGYDWRRNIDGFPIYFSLPNEKIIPSNNPGVVATSGTTVTGTGTDFKNSFRVGNNVNFYSHLTKTGTVSLTIGSDQCVGVGTTFTTDYSVDEVVYIFGHPGLHLISAIADNTNMTLTGNATVNVNNVIHRLVEDLDARTVSSIESATSMTINSALSVDPTGEALYFTDNDIRGYLEKVTVGLLTKTYYYKEGTFYFVNYKLGTVFMNPALEDILAFDDFTVGGLNFKYTHKREEWVSIKEIQLITGDEVLLKGVIRRLFDTNNETWLSGDFIKLIPSTERLSAIGQNDIWAHEDKVDFKLLPGIANATLDRDLIAPVLGEYNSRTRTPYEVNNIRVNGLQNNLTYPELGTIKLEWDFRNRFGGAGLSVAGEPPNAEDEKDGIFRIEFFETIGATTSGTDRGIIKKLFFTVENNFELLNSVATQFDLVQQEFLVEVASVATDLLARTIEIPTVIIGGNLLTAYSIGELIKLGSEDERQIVDIENNKTIIVSKAYSGILAAQVHFKSIPRQDTITIETIYKHVVSGIVSITTGTIASPNAGAVITGVGTDFQSDFIVGERVFIEGEAAREITAIASDISMTVNIPYTAVKTNLFYAKLPILTFLDTVTTSGTTVTNDTSLQSFLDIYNPGDLIYIVGETPREVDTVTDADNLEVLGGALNGVATAVITKRGNPDTIKTRITGYNPNLGLVSNRADVLISKV